MKSDRTNSLGKPVEEIADNLKMTHLYPHVINTQMSSAVWYLPQDGILLGELHSLVKTVEEIEVHLKMAHLNPPVSKVIKTDYLLGSEMMNERGVAAAMASTLDHRIDQNNAPALPKDRNEAPTLRKNQNYNAPAMSKKWNNALIALALLKKQSTCSCSPSNHPKSYKCRRHRSAAVIKKKPTRRADRVLVKRALSPPGRRRSRSCHRRRIFRPTPSRLSKTSMA